MDFRRRISWIRVALGVVLAIGGSLTAGAQTPPGASTTEPYTPAKDAKDLKAVLFNWMWHMGMLKGHDERDMVATLEYQGKGTIQVDGQPCTLTKYRASTNYQTFSQRIQYTCTRANGQNVLEHRGGQRAVRLERRHARCGDRSNEGEGHADAGDRAGAAHPHLGESAGRAQGRAGRDNRDILAGGQPRHAVRGRCREGGPDVRVVGGGQAGRDVPDSGRSRGDRDSHPRCEVHDRARGGHPGRRRPPSSPTATIRTGTTR